jgi:hypothetical protein
MRRSHGILALVWVAALAWAFALTQPNWWPAGQADKAAPLWTLEPKDVQRIEYSEGASRVVLTFDPALRLADGSPAPWIEAEGPAAETEAPPGPIPPKPGAPKPGPPKPGLLKPADMPPPASKPGAAPAAAAAMPEPVEKARFRGGMHASRLVRELTQLAVLRDLGPLDDKQRGEFGLAKPAATLRLERTGAEPLILDLGSTTLAGGTRYAVLRSSGRAYLIQQGPLRGFERARRLMEREWAPFNLAEAKRIDAKVGGRTLTVWQLDLPRQDHMRWARSADAAKGDPVTLKWVQALMGMKVLDYGTPADLPAHPEVMLEVTVTPGAPKPGPGRPPPPAPLSTEPVILQVFKSASKDAERMRAVSGYTGVPVELSAPAVQNVMAQARDLLGAK